jgi:hypothetical protein
VIDPQRDPHAITGQDPDDLSDIVGVIETALHHTPGIGYPDGMGARRLAQRLAATITDHHRRPPTPTAVLAQTEPIRLLVVGLREALQAARDAPCPSCGHRATERLERRTGAGNRVSEQTGNEGNAA